MEEQKSKNKLLKVFAIIGVIAAVAGAVIALCKYFKPDYLEDYEDDLKMITKTKTKKNNLC